MAGESNTIFSVLDMEMLNSRGSVVPLFLKQNEENKSLRY